MSKQYAVPSKVSTVCFLACLFITGVQAADFTITAFDQANPKPSVGHQVVTTVDFPDGTDTYSSVVMVLENFNLDSPLDQDEWDRIASINIINDDGSEFQVARWITPYWNVSHIWTLDVTDLQHLFRGSKRMKLRIVGYASADGNTASVSFEFTLGTPPYYPVRIRGIWPDNGSITSVEFGKASGGWYYLNSETTNFFTDVTMSTLASADQFKSRVIVTGHGFGNTSYNAAEFMPQWQDITVGSRTWGNELWNECSTNPTGSQCAYGPDDDPDCSGSSCCGTWYYDRAGWCPGSVPVPWTVDVSSEVTPGQDVTFDYDHWRYNAGAKLVYTNAGSSSANLSVTSQFIEFVQTNKTIIEPFEDIVINGLDRTTFSGISRRYYFRNFSGSSINWTASDNVDWITTSPSSGTLASGETAAVDVTLNANADQLGVGNHAAALAFADTTNNLSENRQVDLTIVQSEMTAHWNFDETSGTTAADSTGNGFDGTVSGAVWTTGHDGGALDFTASNSDTVDIPAAAFATVSNAVSISMWINGNIADPPLNNSVLYGADASGQRVLNIHLPWSNSGVYWDAGNSGTSSYDRINKTAEASEFSGQWNYWVFTKDATSGEMKIYLNGVLWHSGTGKTLTMSTITSASIGSKLGTKYFYDGLIDDVRVYNYALTAEQVNDLFVCGGSSILETLLVIANRWLDTNCGEFDWCDGADINKDTVVDWFDYASIDCINISR